MIQKLPLLDDRKADKIIKTLDEKMLENIKKKSSSENLNDLKWEKENNAGAMLHKIFARLMEIAIERYNQVPEKNKLKFLEIAGVELFAASPAIVPLTFYPKSNNSPAEVPIFTQATRKTSSTPVIFETQEKLMAVPSKIVSLVTIDLVWDKYSEFRYPEEQELMEFRPFLGSENIPHKLYIGGDYLPDFGDGVIVEINGLDTKSTEFFSKLKYRYKSGDFYINMESILLKFDKTSAPSDITVIDGDGLDVNYKGRWIEVSLPRSFKCYSFDEHNVDGMYLSLSSQGTKPDAVFNNSIPLDASDLIKPFGDIPEIGDTFYISSKYFSIQGAFITIEFQIEGTPTISDDLKISWEFWNGEKWDTLVETSETVNGSFETKQIEYCFTNDYKFIANLSEFTFENYTVNGIEGYWVRARILEGNYGKLESMEYDGVQKEFKKVPSTLKPPVIKNIQISYDFSFYPTILQKTGAYVEKINNLQSALFKGIDEIENVNFKDTTASLYIALDSVFFEYPTTLYFEVSPKSISSDRQNYYWEYFNGEAWVYLDIIDNTYQFSESGTVVFLVPFDMKKIRKFGQEQFWIRVRKDSDTSTQENNPEKELVFNGIFLNTVQAVQTASIKTEFLGSGTGEQNQTFKFENIPIMKGQEVFVRENELPSETELDYLKSEFGGDVVKRVINSYTDEEEIFIRWNEVPNFLCSTSNDRHYTLDRISGKIRFGDGINGQMPPSGIDNIMASYSFGGGEAGNADAGDICVIKSVLPQVEKVINPIAARGGALAETPEMVKLRGPQTIRNRMVATTSEDFEWLVIQAVGTSVARVKCLPNTNMNMKDESGCVTVLVVPNGEHKILEIGPMLIKKIRQFLENNSFAGLNGICSSQLNVCGANFLGIRISVDVIPENIHDSQEVKARVEEALKTYLHPIKGGKRKKGWDFGRNVYSSELISVLEALEGVDHISDIKIRANSIQQRFSVPKSSATNMKNLKTTFNSLFNKRRAYVEKIMEDENITIDLGGFKEGDKITPVLDVGIDKDNYIIGADERLDYFPNGSIIKSLDGLYLGCLQRDGEKVELSFAVDKKVVFNRDKVTVFYPYHLNVTSIYVSNLNNKFRVEFASLENHFVFPENYFQMGITFATLDNRVRIVSTTPIKCRDGCFYFETDAFNNDDYINSIGFSGNIKNIGVIEDVAYLKKNNLVYLEELRVTLKSREVVK